MSANIYIASPVYELSIVLFIIDLKTHTSAKRFILNQFGYNNDEEIIQLLIRTSMGIDELYTKLLALSYNVDKDHIQVVESGTVCVPLPKNILCSDHIPIYGKFMSLA